MFPPSLTTMLPKFGWVISSVLFVLIVVYGFYIRDMWTVRAHNLWQLQCNQKAFIPCPTCSFFKVDNKGVIQSINLNLWDTAGQVPPDPPIKLILCDSLSKVHNGHPMFKRSGTRFNYFFIISSRRNMTLFDHSPTLERYGQCKGPKVFKTMALPLHKELIFSIQDIFLVCFSVNTPDSYENVRAKWIGEVQASNYFGMHPL